MGSFVLSAGRYKWWEPRGETGGGVGRRCGLVEEGRAREERVEEIDEDVLIGDKEERSRRC